MPLRIALAFFLFMVGHAAFAAPGRCQVGYADSTCVAFINSPYQTAPTCSSAAGWRTNQAAVWQGSHYSSPQCTYVAPPTCSAGAGWVTSVWPSWDGWNWSAPGCTYIAAPTCSTSPGWVTTAWPSWNGWSWSTPGCSYISPPTCPPGQSMITGPGWTGSGWTSPVCQPIAFDPATSCQAATGGYTPTDVVYWVNASNMFNPSYYQNLYGYPSNTTPWEAVKNLSSDPMEQLGAHWNGPTYPDAGTPYGVCGFTVPYGNVYAAICWVNPNGSVYTMEWVDFYIKSGCGGGH